MAEKTLTRAHIIEVMAQRLSISRQKCTEILEDMLDLMEAGIIKNSSLKLASFGSFSIRKKKTRVGRNPKTGQEVMITPRKTISFKASHVLKDKVVKRKQSF